MNRITTMELLIIVELHIKFSLFPVLLKETINTFYIKSTLSLI